ncbi:hypothetical protein F2Q69_00049319 [Brassica cretica]|uniref:1-acylglycerol-3-phosphate O-acyltransferase n=1 Tax=Brassica cretica TaxID=69181 RepID=A0A8S9PX62_BRACR|nr:hypothetical protein F2Q69_00049319 [Brassica cretica]
MAKAGAVVNFLQIQVFADDETSFFMLIWELKYTSSVYVRISNFSDCFFTFLLGQEHTHVVFNHRSDIGWLVGWIPAQRSGCLGSALAASWSVWFSEYLFLERNWAKDESTLKSDLQRLSDFPRPFWLALLCGGNSLYEAKLKAPQEYAASSELPIPRNVLIPRTKSGLQRLNYFPRPFWLALFVEGTRFTEAKLKEYAASSELPIPRNDFVSAVSNLSHPYMICPLLFKGQPSGKQVHVHIKYHSIKDLPESEDEIAQWCRVQFLAKDKLLDKHITSDTFPGQQEQNIGRLIKSRTILLAPSMLYLRICLVLHASLVIFSCNDIKNKKATSIIMKKIHSLLNLELKTWSVGSSEGEDRRDSSKFGLESVIRPVDSMPDRAKKPNCC